ncbi:MAG: OmpA family protein [Candidatus Sumerlaeia bacterium]|nr:OmpA family protein [Candidatus Sumerlaeia bacterium]
MLRRLLPAALLAAAALQSGCFLQARALRDERNMLATRVDMLTQELNVERQGHEETRAALASAEQRAAQLDAQTGRLRGTVAQLSQPPASAPAPGTSLDDLAARQREAEELSARLASTELRAVDAEERLAEERRAKEDLQRRLDSAAGGSDAARRDLALAQGERDAFRAEVTALKKAAAESSARIASLEAELSTLKGVVATAESEKKSLEERLAAEAAKPAAGDPEALRAAIKTALPEFSSITGTKDGAATVTLLSDDLFEPATTRLSDTGLRRLREIAEFLRARPATRVEVVGHTDSQPIGRLPYADNWELAAERALEVARWLSTQPGVAPERIGAASRAYHDPVADNATAAGRRLNRRVELRLAE